MRRPFFSPCVMTGHNSLTYYERECRFEQRYHIQGTGGQLQLPSDLKHKHLALFFGCRLVEVTARLGFGYHLFMIHLGEIL